MQERAGIETQTLEKAAKMLQQVTDCCPPATQKVSRL